MSAIIEIYPEEPCLLPVQYPSDPLVAYGKTYSDIEEIYMGFKKVDAEADDAYLAKYWKDGNGGGAETGDVLKDEGTHTFTMNKLETDVLPSGEYGIYIGVKVAGLSKMLWLRVNRSNKIKVVLDGVVQ